MYKRSGFTIIEILIVVAIALIVVGVLLSGFQNYARYQGFKAANASVALTLDQVRADAKVALQDRNHGVKFASDQITTYVGDVYSVGDSSNVVVTLDGVTIIPNLTNGTTEVVFGKVNGFPSATGTIQVVGNNYNGTTTFTLTEAGVVHYE